MSSSTATKSQRVLACILCQQRKVKCDRTFPCTNCIKSREQCVPASLLPRQKRRRFPEKVLLDRLRKYETLLTEHNIPFEPLHPGPKANSTTAGEGDDVSEGEADKGRRSGMSTTASVKSEGFEAKSIWHAMSQGFRDPGNESDSSEDDVRETVVKTALDRYTVMDDNLIFGFCRTHIDLSTLHPTPIHIIKLWHFFLDNVNPLLKVVHAPTMQGRLLEAAGNPVGLDRNLEALMFSIYCGAVFTLTEEECLTQFGASRDDLTTRYQFGCQQALLNCGFLRTSDRECLTALLIYLISVRATTIPTSMNSMLGVAVRIAVRMGINNESSLAKHSILEAELRRRLWWALALFDDRLNEMAGSRATVLDPTWDCRVPLNVSDSDLRLEMKVPALVHSPVTDSLYVVLRARLADLARFTSFELDFQNPALKATAKAIRDDPLTDAEQLAKAEEQTETQIIRYCDEGNPLHFVAIWTFRSSIAKFRLMDHHARHVDSTVRQTDADYALCTGFALRWLDCNTRLCAAPLVANFRWMQYFYFPFPAYLQVVQDLRRRPANDMAEEAWRVLSENYEAWYEYRMTQKDSPFFKIFSDIVLQAWEAREEVLRASGSDAVRPPTIVVSIREVHDWQAAGRPSDGLDQGLGSGAGRGDGVQNPLYAMASGPPSDDINLGTAASGLSDLTPMDSLQAVNTQSAGYDQAGNVPDTFGVGVIGGWPGWGA